MRLTGARRKRSENCSTLSRRAWSRRTNDHMTSITTATVMSIAAKPGMGTKQHHGTEYWNRNGNGNIMTQLPHIKLGLCFSSLH